MVKLNNGYVPETLEEALTIMRDEKVKPYSGGTDLMLEVGDGASYLF